MTLGQSLLQEFDQEMATARRLLEIIPEDKLDWQAHPKSMSLRELATHIANLPTWAGTIVEQEVFDVAPPGETRPTADPVPSVGAALSAFDENLATARQTIVNATDETMRANWTLLKSGDQIMQAPRIAVVRSFVMNHMIHHRAQLGVYLRLNDVPLPSTYGPTADIESY